MNEDPVSESEERANAVDLLPQIYEELRGLAAGYLRNESAGHTLQPTALVHEACLRILKQSGVRWKNRGHSCARSARKRCGACSRITRGRKRADKRGGAGRAITLVSELLGGPHGEGPDALSLEVALEKLAGVSERQARIVELRFFGGLTVPETAAELEVSQATVEEDWRFARAWLNRELSAVTDAGHERLVELFTRARRLAGTEREAFLTRACGADAALRAEVESLLHHDGSDALERAEQAIAAGARELGERGAPLPESLGGYRILRLIGAGGMGVVYEAEQDHPQRRVALKVIRSAWPRPASLRRFEHEAQVLGRLDHPGIARIFEAGTADGTAGPQPYFAMELVRGEPIQRYARAHSLDVRARLELFARVCRRGAPRAPEGRRAPRPQAGQHPGRRERPAQGARLRRRPRHGRRPEDDDRADARGRARRHACPT